MELTVNQTAAFPSFYDLGGSPPLPVHLGLPPVRLRFCSFPLRVPLCLVYFLAIGLTSDPDLYNSLLLPLNVSLALSPPRVAAVISFCFGVLFPFSHFPFLRPFFFSRTRFELTRFVFGPPQTLGLFQLEPSSHVSFWS